MEKEDKIYLQQIKEENGVANTYLIAFDKATGKTEIIQEMGWFILSCYDEKKKIIKGYGSEEEIELLVDW